ncbi:MAG: tetratricopeptide repeat protein [Phycisphaerales bacterium]|nr:tetratricopeptide repeat protein [Phycisphaerales bacterium]
MAWKKRRAPADGASYIDALVRKSSPDTDAANAVINDLAELAGGLNKCPGLLAAQALVLDVRGRSDFAIQQLTKAFDISLDDDQKILSWNRNVVRFFEDKDTSIEVAYLDSVRRRTDVEQIENWIDLFIAMRLTSGGKEAGRAIDLLKGLVSIDDNLTRRFLAYQTYGSYLYGQDNFEGALQVWTDGLAHFPDNWELNNNIAFTLSVELGRPEDALKYAQPATQSGAINSEPYETLARVYIQLGRFDEAVEMINKGKRYATSIASRVTMMLADARLNIARKDLEIANFDVLNARSLFRSLPGGNDDIEESIKKVEEEIASAG